MEDFSDFLKEIGDPVLRGRVKLRLAEAEQEIDKLAKNNAKLLDQNVQIKKKYNVPQAVTISREDARDHRKYMEAKARAEKAGVPLTIIGHTMEVPEQADAHAFKHDDRYFVSHAYVRKHGPTRISKEAAGREVVYFENADQLPKDAREVYDVHGD